MHNRFRPITTHIWKLKNMFIFVLYSQSADTLHHHFAICSALLVMQHNFLVGCCCLDAFSMLLKNKYHPFWLCGYCSKNGFALQLSNNMHIFPLLLSDRNHTIESCSFPGFGIGLNIKLYSLLVVFVVLVWAAAC